MKKETKVKKEVFSLTKHFGGKVKRLSLHFQDGALTAPEEGKEHKVHTVVFGTLQLFIEGEKKVVENVNFMFPLTVNVDLKNHITAIISEAIKNKEKEAKKNGGK